MLAIRPVKGIYAKTGESFHLTMEYESDHIVTDVNWSLSGSTLPAGLVLDEKTGSITRGI